MSKKRYSGFLKGLSGACLTAVLMLSPLGSMGSLAAGTEAPDAPYDYQITFYAGNQGAFAAGPSIQVLGADGSRKEASVEAGADAVRVKGLEAGDRVVFDQIQGDAVDLGPDSPYYVRGIRKSGYDNDDEKPASFLVEQDQDYVVAYGVKGDLVSYVIHYEDSAGRSLADSRTYYGNVGDRPVVAFRYVEGYEPQAYNLTKTLSKNEAENVFTFVYSRVQTGGGGGTGGGSGNADAGTGGTAGGTAGTEGAAGAGGAAGTGGAAAGTGGAAAGAGGAAAGTGGAAAGAGGAAGTAGDAAGTETPEEGAGAGVEAPDEEVPADEGPRDLVDLDDEETPLSDFPVDGEGAKAGVLYSLPVIASLSLIVAVILAAGAGLKYRAVRRKREQDEEEE